LGIWQIFDLNIAAEFTVFSNTILRKASRSASEEEDSEYFSNYLWLFRTRMPVLRRQDLL
jgi:hypothetical protein